MKNAPTIQERMKNVEHSVLDAVLRNAPDRITTIHDAQEMVALWTSVLQYASYQVNQWNKDVKDKALNIMPTFDFKPHTFLPEQGLQARYAFDNGYEVSIVKGNLFYCNAIPANTPDATYEVGILYNDNLVYGLPLVIDGTLTTTQDVCGHLDAFQVSQIILQVAKYPKPTTEAQNEE